MPKDYQYVPLPPEFRTTRPVGPVRDQRSEAARLEALLATRDRLAQQTPTERLIAGMDPTLAGTRRSAAPTVTLASLAGRESPPDELSFGLNPKRWIEEKVFTPAVSGVGSLIGALDRPPTGYPADTPYTSPLRIASSAFATMPAAAGTVYDALAGRRTDAPVVDPMRPSEEQAMFSGEVARRGGGRIAQGFGTVADLLVGPEHGLQLLGAAAPVLMGAGKFAKVAKEAQAARALTSTGQRLSIATDVLSSLDDVQRNALLTEITNRFPRLDAYAKPASYLSPKMLAAKSADLSPTAQSFVRAMADNVREPISPLELHALAKGAEYTPERVVRRGHTTAAGDAGVSRNAKFAGAPHDVSTVGHERTRLKSYLDQVELGKDGADWYDNGGTGTLFAMGDDVERAREFADVEAITSPATSVDVNTGFALEGVEQLESGLPVKTGRFPAAMSAAIAKLRGQGDVTGLKRLPFSQQIQLGGNFSTVGSPRSVHDIWDMEAWGYTNPDGAPLRRGATEAEHRWMDAMTERAIADANKRKLGGRTDWTTGRLQAAAWTGAKIRAGKLAPGAAVEDIASSFAKRQFELSREAIPGKTAQHLEGLAGPELDQYARDQFGIDTDPQARSRLAMSQRAVVARGGEAPGVFEGDVSPGYQARIVVPIKPDPRGGTQVYPPSMDRAKRIEASYAFSRAQDAGAGSRLTDWPTQKEYEQWQASTPDQYQWPMRGAEITLNRTPTSAEVAQIDSLMTKAAGGKSGQVAVVSLPGQGARLGNLPDSPLSLKEFDRAAADAAKLLNAPTPKRGRFDSLYVSNDWQKKTLGQEYWQYLPESGSLGERELQRQVQEVAARDAAVVKANPAIASNALIQEIRAVYAKGGIDAMRAFATARGLPLAAVLLALGLGAQSRPSGGDSPRRSSGGDSGQPRLNSRLQGGA